MSDVIHSLGASIGWILRNKGTFLMSLGGVATAFATGILAIFTIKMARANTRLIAISNAQFELNRRQFNRQFLSSPYEMVALLMTNTLEMLGEWLEQLQNMGDKLEPESAENQERIRKLTEMAKLVDIKLKLYPSEHVNPAVERWMTTLYEVMGKFTGLYDPKSKEEYGEYRVAGEKLDAAIAQIPPQIEQMAMQLNSILLIMSQELAV